MKQHYRFGMAYFSTRPLWVRPVRDGSGISTTRLVIRDTHQEWDVKELFYRYIQKGTNVESTQPEAESQTQDSTPGGEADTGASGAVAG